MSVFLKILRPYKIGDPYVGYPKHTSKSPWLMENVCLALIKD